MSPVKNGALTRVSKVIDTELADEDLTIEYIARNPPTPEHETLCSFDGLYLQFYWCTSGVWVDLINDGMTNEKHPLAICAALRFGPHLSSKPVRSAVLFYASYRKEGKVSCLGMEYLAQFYEGAREAIDRSSYVELVYACYAMCLFEMASKRLFSEEFQKHANGFLISYQHLVRTAALTIEENKFMKTGYDMITQATHITSSQWYQSESWFPFTQTCIQRLESAVSRVLNSAKATSLWKIRRTWIPESHHLHGTEYLVYQLCALFNRLAIIRRNETEGRNFQWIETAVTVGDCLNTLWEIISKPAIIEENSMTSFILKDGITAIPGDKFTRQLLTLYYIFLFQYLVLVEQWSDSTCAEVIETSAAICRLFPAHYESTYPGSEIQFTIHRGLILAGILVMHAHYNPGTVIQYQN